MKTRTIRPPRSGTTRACGIAAAAFVATTFIGQAPAHALSCEALTSLALANTTIDAAQSIPAGTYTPVGGSAIADMPAICRVHGFTSPVPGSKIGFEIWLPMRNWNSKVFLSGSGGYSPGIVSSYANLAGFVKRGYAGVATDTGHVSGDDPDFILTYGREAIADWAYRAVHESVVKGKDIVNAFYGTPAKYAYYTGCSTGGSQGLGSAQRFPTDFNGIIAGDPGNNRTHLNVGFLWQYLSNHKRNGQLDNLMRRAGWNYLGTHNKGNVDLIIPASKLAMIQKASVAACVAQNGARNGGLPTDNYLDDPHTCGFDPSTLLCKGADAADCLTADQVAAMKKMYAGAIDPNTGERIYFGWPMGSEAGWATYWADFGNPTWPTRTNFWKLWAFNDPNWDWWNVNWSTDFKIADNTISGIVDQMNPNLEPFRSAGGKLIMYHGMADPVVPPMESVSYLERVIDHHRAAGNGTLTADQSRAEVNQFLRLFQMPGVSHCSGGNGPLYVTADMYAALENWVEKGSAPDTLVARYPQSAAGTGTPTFTRPLCVYPKQARYNGTGDSKAASSFTCADPAQSRVVIHQAPVYQR